MTQCSLLPRPAITYNIIMIRAEREVKIASPDESGRIVTHENVPFSSNGNYERRSSKLADENAKCPSCI